MRNSLIKDGRLAAAYEMLGISGLVADVGCDHGYLSAELVLSGRAERVIASDISPVSVNKAAALARAYGITDRMSAVTADGLSPLKDEPGPYKIAVCGMGGKLISRLLEEGAEAASRAELIVMQPMRGEAELRRYLYENAYRIADERVVREGRRFYQVIASVPNERDTIPEGFPEGWFRFGWVMAKKREPELIPLLRHYRSVYARELGKARAEGKNPESILAELNNTEALLRFMGTE